MSHSGGSLKVVLFALSANLGIAVAKFIGAFFTKSASLLAEAIHSLVDCGNQILLLVGNKQSQKAPNHKHPLGYGRATFFWAFVVAILLFSLGGLFAIREGFHKLEGHEPIDHPAVAVGILILSLILEGFSFRACIQEIRIQQPEGGLWNWFRRSTSAELLVVFIEDAAALSGLSVALVATVIGWATGNPAWDAGGSIAIGIVLVAVALLLASEVKSLLIGEAPSHDYHDEIIREISNLFPGGALLHLIALQTGSRECMVSFKLHPGRSIHTAQELIEQINELERRLKKRFTEIRWLFVEPDYLD
ncbi:MAG: cation diffusion facilitator family transporter [Cryobacterium sp.]|nr:cation diffusion facilitator family transporter [Oligoflexia bacterium]